MSAELDELLAGMLTLALHRAERVPTPEEPPSEGAERAADAYCRGVAQTEKVEMPSPLAAVALIPRLRIARAFGSLVASALGDPAKLEASRAEEADLLERLLIGYWHSTWKPRWLRGELP